MTDLEMMCGKFTLEDGGGMTVDGVEKNAVLTGIIPVSTVKGYSVTVTSYTKGLGHFSCVLKGYYPCHNTEEVVERIGYRPEEDIRNTADSVFCSHGAGVVIPWNEVKEHMHIAATDVGIYQPKYDTAVYYEGMKPMIETDRTKEDIVMGTEEIDAIINRTMYSNRKDDFSHKPGYLKKKSAPKDYGSNTISSQTRVYNPKPKSPKYLLVDGYNVIFAWQDLRELAEANIDAARGKLQDILCNYQAIRQVEVILVFDAYKVAGHGTEFLDYQNIHIVYTKEAETADYYIEHFAHENSRRYDITVVTSDGLEQVIIRGAGCALISSREFEEEVKTASGTFSQEYEQKAKKENEKTYLGEFLPQMIFEKETE